jgi:hypothetical protein
MHPGDVLVFGPVPPLLRRSVRLSVRALLLASGGLAIALLLLVGMVLVGWPYALRNPMASVAASGPASKPDDKVSVVGRPVEVLSEPAGASVWLDNRLLGRTPATVVVPTTDALLTLRFDGFADAFVRASGSTLDASLWRAQPVVRWLRPPVPGAAIRSAEFLPDGRVALAIDVPPGGERQPWAYDPIGAHLERLGHAPTPGTLPSTVAVAPDGTRTASILHLDGLDGAAADQLTLDGPDGPHQPLDPGPVGERLLDVTWSPNADGVLLLSQRQTRGGTQFVQRWVGTDGAVREVVELPKAPVVGSWVWAPDGHAVAFLVQGDPITLVTLDTTTGELRNLEDLRADAVPTSGAVAPAAWELSGSLLYAAPAKRLPGSASTTAPVLFAVAPGRVDAHRIGDVEPVWAPVAVADGVLLTLARADNDVLVLRTVDQSGHALGEQRLGVQVSGAFAARWDLSHQQLLIVRAIAGNAVEVLLLRFADEDRAIRTTTSASAPEVDQ